MSGRLSFLLMWGFFALKTEEAILTTFDLTSQVKYPCPSSGELSCVILWKLNPSYGLISSGENIFRLECESAPPVDSHCRLPDVFELNSTKLIKPKTGIRHIENIARYYERGTFIDIGCKPTETAICIVMNADGLRMKNVRYILDVRCRNIQEKNCPSHPFVPSEKVTMVFPYREVLSTQILFSE